MKPNFTLKALAALALMGSFYACENDDVYDPNNRPLEISIAKPAEFKIEAGGRTLVKSDNGRRNALPGNTDVLYFKKSNCPDLYRADFPAQKLYQDECNHVYACIKEDAALLAAGQPAKYEVAKESFTSKAFYIVNAYSAKDHDAKGNHSNVAGDMHDLGINGQYIKEFNTNVCVAADLVITTEGLQDITYDDSFGVKHETYTTSEWKLFYIPDYGYYAGMDYGTNKFGYEPDGEYSDWVVKLIPATPKEEPIDETNGSVEVNLSVNDEHSEGDFIATKLSIHIRALTDAEVFIPVDKRYYCEADDMDISLSHKNLDVIYKTEAQHVEKEIGGAMVSFIVQYEDEGIRITTDGVNQALIDFCADTYADGITFEVWNYFKDITRADLKPMLDQATITFLDRDPMLYVNAFAKETGYYETPIYNKFNEQGQLEPYTDADCTKPLDHKYWTRETPDSKDYIFVGQPNPWDCTVAPTDPNYQKTEPDAENPTLPNYNVEYSL